MGAQTAYFLMGNINTCVSGSKIEVSNFENLTRKMCVPGLSAQTPTQKKKLVVDIYHSSWIACN